MVFSVWLVLLVLVGGDSWTVAGEEWLCFEVAVSIWLSGGLEGGVVWLFRVCSSWRSFERVCGGVLGLGVLL